MNFNIKYQPVKTEKQKAELSATMKEVAQVRNQNPTYIENLHNGISNRDNTYQAEVNSRPEVRAKHRQNQTGKPKSKEHKAALKATTTNRYGNADYEAAHTAGLANRDRPFHAGEYGVFPNRSKAAKYAQSIGLSNAIKKFEKWTKTRPSEYRFITHDEYEKLKGKQL
jgi:hypothetical protein